MRLGYMNLPRLSRRASGIFPVFFFLRFAAYSLGVDPHCPPPVVPPFAIEPRCSSSQSPPPPPPLLVRRCSPIRLVPSCCLAPVSDLPLAPARKGKIRRRNRTELGGFPAESSSLLQQVTRIPDLSGTRMCFTCSDWESGLGWSSI
jgi:hypothetical protein